MSLIRLTINRQTKSLVASTVGDGSGGTLPPLFPDIQNFSVQVVDPPTNINGANVTVDCSASTLRAVVAQQVSGSDGSVLLAATYEGGWAWDIPTQAFLGVINLRTNEIMEAIGSGTEVACILEFNLDGQVIYGALNGADNMIINAKADTGVPYVPVAAPLTGGSLQIKNGVGGLALAGNVITVTGLGYGVAPSRYDLKVITPAGSGFIDASFIIGSATSGGFQAVLSAIPPNDNYFLTFTPIA